MGQAKPETFGMFFAMLVFGLTLNISACSEYKKYAIAVLCTERASEADVVLTPQFLARMSGPVSSQDTVCA